MRGGRPHSTHEGLGATPIEEGTHSRHSGSFSYVKGVGSLDTQSGSHSEELAHADASNFS